MDRPPRALANWSCHSTGRHLTNGCSVTSTRSARSHIRARSVLFGIGSADALRLTPFASARLTSVATIGRECRCAALFLITAGRGSPALFLLFSRGLRLRGSKIEQKVSQGRGSGGVKPAATDLSQRYLLYFCTAS